MFRVYKKTSAAVCERPGGPELWTISSIVSSLALPQSDTEITDVQTLASSHSVETLVLEPRLLIFNFMICFILLPLNSRLRGPPEGEDKI